MLGFLSGSLIFVSGLARADDAPSPPVSPKRINHEVHSAIVSDESLPYCAHVVNVNCQNGKVILNGRVDTPDEKKKVGEKGSRYRR